MGGADDDLGPQFLFLDLDVDELCGDVLEPSGAVGVDEADEGLQVLGVVVLPFDQFADFVPVFEAGQFRVLGAAAGHQVGGGVGDVDDVFLPAGEGDAASLFESCDDGREGARVGFGEDGVRFGDGSEGAAEVGVAFEHERRAEQGEVLVPDAGHLGAEPPRLGEGQFDVGGPVGEGVLRSPERVDALVGVADHDGLVRLLLDDSREDGIDVLRLIKDDHFAGQGRLCQGPQLQVVVEVEVDLVADGVLDVLPRGAGVPQDGVPDRAGRLGQAAGQVRCADLVVGAVAVGHVGGFHQTGDVLGFIRAVLGAYRHVDAQGLGELPRPACARVVLARVVDLLLEARLAQRPRGEGVGGGGVGVGRELAACLVGDVAVEGDVGDPLGAEFPRDHGHGRRLAGAGQCLHHDVLPGDAGVDDGLLLGCGRELGRLLLLTGGACGLVPGGEVGLHVADRRGALVERALVAPATRIAVEFEPVVAEQLPQFAFLGVPVALTGAGEEDAAVFLDELDAVAPRSPDGRLRGGGH